VGLGIDMVEEEESKGYWDVVNRPKGQLWNKAVDKDLDRLDRAGTWGVVDKVDRGKELGSK
jgi:hypothetical protein